MKKFKYLEFRERPFNTGELVAQVDVSDLSGKKAIDNKWDELERTFGKDKYQSCLVTTSQERRTFINAPKNN